MSHLGHKSRTFDLTCGGLCASAMPALQAYALLIGRQMALVQAFIRVIRPLDVFERWSSKLEVTNGKRLGQIPVRK